ncbi:hypothetical protein ACFZBU_45360 [Embleya sp. NPDC008237]|uniref:hypothetical protein n=1 Tax=Embleya sp. NPDC008237 TaxID=3363978 RepID=UPI0036E4411A
MRYSDVGAALTSRLREERDRGARERHQAVEALGVLRLELAELRERLQQADDRSAAAHTRISALRDGNRGRQRRLDKTVSHIRELEGELAEQRATITLLHREVDALLERERGTPAGDRVARAATQVTATKPPSRRRRRRRARPRGEGLRGGPGGHGDDGADRARALGYRVSAEPASRVSRKAYEEMRHFMAGTMAMCRLLAWPVAGLFVHLRPPDRTPEDWEGWATLSSMATLFVMYLCADPDVTWRTRTRHFTAGAKAVCGLLAWPAAGLLAYVLFILRPPVLTNDDAPGGWKAYVCFAVTVAMLLVSLWTYLDATWGIRTRTMRVLRDHPWQAWPCLVVRGTRGVHDVRVVLLDDRGQPVAMLADIPMRDFLGSLDTAGVLWVAGGLGEGSRCVIALNDPTPRRMSTCRASAPSPLSEFGLRNDEVGDGHKVVNRARYTPRSYDPEAHPYGG